MYWDAKKSTYIPVDQQSQQTPVDEASIEAAASVTPEPATPAVEEKPKNIPKTAAQIAKVSMLTKLMIKPNEKCLTTCQIQL